MKLTVLFVIMNTHDIIAEFGGVGNSRVAPLVRKYIHIKEEVACTSELRIKFSFRPHSMVGHQIPNEKYHCKQVTPTLNKPPNHTATVGTV